VARIVTVFNDWHDVFRPVEMSFIEWVQISKALAKLGHEVDIASNEKFPWWQRRRFPVRMGGGVRRIPLRGIDWREYDAVLTIYHSGWRTLEKYGGTEHSLVVSKLGSVVAPEDREGIYFYGQGREKLYTTQVKIARHSTYVSLLSQPARALWEECFGPKANVVVIPGGVDGDIPPPRRDPFPRDGQKRCIFAGNVYLRTVQPEANQVLVAKLNRLGRLLEPSGIRLYMLGFGDVQQLDRRHVAYLGVVPHDEIWDFFHFADVGIVVAPGTFLHNNESTKIYHYLRVGLPMVSEAGFPNDHVVRESGLGYVVTNGDIPAMAERIWEATQREWDRERARQYILAQHTWDRRAEAYDAVMRNHAGAAWTKIERL
jgi:glycosyltransferase involved in cell wall biosynthesis